MRWLVALGTLVLVALPASGSFIEDTLEPAGVHYQHDGAPGDAPATCAEVDPARGVVLDGEATTGMLVDFDDESDVYGFELTSNEVGDRIQVDLLSGLLNDRYDVAFDVFSPDCQSSVFNVSSAYYDPPPQEPYQPPIGSTTHEAKLTGATCEPAQWKFLANQMHGLPAPADIYVEWTNGEYEYVAVDKSTPATIAMYRTSSNLDVTVEKAVIVLPPTWTGQFKLASGPCDAVEGIPLEEPEFTTTYGEFTVQEAGTHIVQVYISRNTLDKTTDTVNDLVSDPPTTIPVNCHSDICSAAFSDASYDFLSKNQNNA